MKKNWITGLPEHRNDGAPDRFNASDSPAPARRCAQPPPRRQGMTLVEVMLAVVILGIGAGTLLTATARCMAVATRAKHYSRAQRLILQVGAENPIARGEIDDGSESGHFDDGYDWEREIIESEEDDREGLYTIRTRVSWSSRGKESFEEMVSYQYIPPEESDVDTSKRKTSSAGSSSRKSSGSSSGSSSSPGGTP